MNDSTCRLNEIINTPVKINFFTKKESSSKNEKELEILKENMVELCRPYIDFSEEKEAKEECNNRGNPKLLETENEIICDNCGVSKMKTLNFSSYNDNERVSYSQKYKYKKINHLVP